MRVRTCTARSHAPRLLLDSGVSARKTAAPIYPHTCVNYYDLIDWRKVLPVRQPDLQCAGRGCCCCFSNRTSPNTRCARFGSNIMNAPTGGRECGACRGVRNVLSDTGRPAHSALLHGLGRNKAILLCSFRPAGCARPAFPAFNVFNPIEPRSTVQSWHGSARPRKQAQSRQCNNIKRVSLLRPQLGRPVGSPTRVI